MVSPFSGRALGVGLWKSRRSSIDRPWASEMQWVFAWKLASNAGIQWIMGPLTNKHGDAIIYPRPGVPPKGLPCDQIFRV